MDRKPPLGAAPRGKGKTSFLVWAPAAERVDLHILPPKGRRVTMQRRDGGYHGIEVEGIRPGDLYVYRLDGLIERPDPASRSQPLGPCGPSAVVDDVAAREKSPWRGLELRDTILAEPVGSELSFDAIRSRIDQLSALGFNALRVPLAAGRGFPFSVPPSQGGPDGLKRLVEACHRRGLAVLLALDLFETGIEGEPLVFFGPYFTGRDRCFNLGGPLSDEVRRYFTECVLSRFRETGVDALDIGPVDGLADPSPLTLLEELSCAVHDEAKRIGRPLHLVARSGQNDPRLIRRREDGGIGLDAVWNPDFEEALHALLRGAAAGPGSDFGRLEHVRKAFLEGFVCSGGYSPTRLRRHGRSSRALPGERFLVRARPAAAGERRHGPDGADAFLCACLLLSPFLPLLAADGGGPAGGACCADLIRLRKELRAMGLLDKQCMGALGYERQEVLLVRHWKDDADLIILFHFGRRPVRISVPIPAGTWALRFDSADRRWDGPGSALPGPLQGDGGDVSLPLAPLSCAVYLRQRGERTAVKDP